MQDLEITKKLKGWGNELLRGVERWFSLYIKNEEDKPLAGKRLAREVGRGLIGSATAFLLARGSSVGGTHPFGLALLCATGSRGFYTLAGLLFSSFWGGDRIDGIAAVLCLVLRFLVGRLLNGKRAPLFREPLPIRMAIGAAGGFTVGLYRIIAGGFQKESLGHALFLIVALPTVIYLFYGMTEGREVSIGRRQAGRLTLLYAGVLALGSFSLLTFSPNKMAAFFLMLAFAVNGGSLMGCLAGVIGGLACGPLYSPMLALAGLTAGALKGRGLSVVLLAAIGVGGGFSLCTEGIVAFTSTIPALLWGGAFYWPAARFGLLKRVPVFGREETLPAEMAASAVMGLRREAETRERLTALSDAMSSLSEVFYALSNRLATPGTYQLRELCETCFKKYCSSCRQNGICWGTAYDRTADILNKLATAVASHGTADSAYVPDEFLRRCPHAVKALSEVNLSHARLLEQAAKQNKTEIFALDYEALATLLANASEESAEEFRMDEELTSHARRAAVEMGMVWNNIAVFGSRRKTLVAGGIELTRVRLTAEELCQAFSQACGMRFTVPEFRVEHHYVTMMATAAPIISCESARASLRKESEEVNGDSAVIFENREGYFYALLSDGMGSGTDAAITSRITCIFLEKLLAAGNRKNTVLKMLNQFIRHKNLECFATVDLLEIDLLSGEASFVKSGAAASYILREGKLFKLESSSLPIGITREITAEEIRFALLPGDLVVMISDGISQSFEDGVWLLELLSSQIQPQDPLPTLTRRILEEAKQKNHRSDDMTVELVRIHEA